MTTKLSQLSPPRKLVILLAILLIIVSWWRVLSASAGLTVRTFQRDGLPMRYLAPDGASEVPGVLIAHGFGGSTQIMLGYAYKLAHAGYGVLLWDFDGHAANSAPFARQSDSLGRNLDAAYAGLVAQPEIDSTKIALLGHSMGSGAVLEAGIRDAERYSATIAVSPTNASVTSEAPRNLLLLAGEWEPGFVENAEDLLLDAGGAVESFAGGKARALLVAPNAEHILILFSATAQDAAVDWLNKTFGLSAGEPFRDQRLLWYGLSLVGWMALLTASSPLLRRDAGAEETARRKIPRVWLGLLWAPFAAAVVTAALDAVAGIGSLGGLMVGGALGVWFLVMGLLWLFAGRRPPLPGRRDLLRGLALFIILWFAIGALAHFVWLPWLLVPARLVRWPFMALAYLPWLLAAGRAQQGASSFKRTAYWFTQSLLIAAGLILMISLVPSLSVLILVLPMLPLLFGLMTIAGGAFNDSWAFAIGNTLFFGWAMMGYFPLSG